MLKFLTALVAAFCILVFAAEVRRASERPHPSIHQPSAAGKHNAADRRPAEENENAKLTLYTYWLTSFTGILALATIGLGAATVGLYFAGERQLKLAKETSDRQAIEIQNQISIAGASAEAAKRQLDLARDQFNSTHRPVIRFRHIWLSSPIQYGSPIKGSVTCVNSGTGIAKIGQIGTRFYVLQRGKALPMPSEYVPKEASANIIPGQAFPLPDTTYTLSKKEEIAITNGDAALFFVGYVIYWDAADQPRTSSFCRVMPQPGSPEDNGLLAVYKDPNYEFQD
jgi:hypothetical protein